MARGRKPDGPELQQAKGNPGRRPKPKKHGTRSPEERAAALAAATPPDAKFGPPDFMGDPHFDGAIAIWRELSPELARIGLLDRLDRHALAIYCVHMADWIDATKDIAANGTHYKAKNVNKDDLWRRNPAVLVRELAEKHILELGERFGLNPATRFKLLRDQSLIPNSGLFGDRDAPPAKEANADTPPATTESDDVDDENPTGLMSRRGSEVPTQLN